MAYVKCLMNVISSTIPDGKTVTPTDDVSILLACAGRTETYTTISALLADATALAGVINSNNAIDYLVRSTTFASDVCADQGAMADIGANNYASDTLLANSTWLTAICGSSYFESVLNVKVPVMTSNTTPSGVCYANSVNPNSSAHYAFNDSTADAFLPASGATNISINYTFPNEVNVFMMKVSFRRQNNQERELNYQYSTDGTTYTNVDGGSITVANGSTQYDHTIIKPLTGVGFGLNCANTMYVSGSWILGIYKMNFYGRANV